MGSLFPLLLVREQRYGVEKTARNSGLFVIHRYVFTRLYKQLQGCILISRGTLNNKYMKRQEIIQALAYHVPNQLYADVCTWSTPRLVQLLEYYTFTREKKSSLIVRTVFDQPININNMSTVVITSLLHI